MNSVDLWIMKRNVNTAKQDSNQLYLDILKNYISDGCLEIYHNEYGKPMVKNNRKQINNNLFFSISHTANIMVVAVTETCEIGIDIELITRKSLDSRLIAKKFFHRIEQQTIEASSNKCSTFIKLWVIKESYVKMKGEGLSYGLSKFYVDLSQNIIADRGIYYSYQLINILDNILCAISPKFHKVNLKLL